MTQLQKFQNKFPSYEKTLSPKEKELLKLRKEADRIETHSYWNDKGRFQNIYDKLWSEVPDVGESEDRDVEAVRCMSNILRDVYNNGGCNLVGTIHVDDDYYKFDICWGNYEDEFRFIDNYLNDTDYKYTDPNETELGELILDGQAWGGYNNNDLAKLERFMNLIIRKAYATKIARGTKQRDLTTTK